MTCLILACLTVLLEDCMSKGPLDMLISANSDVSHHFSCSTISHKDYSDDSDASAVSALVTRQVQTLLGITISSARERAPRRLLLVWSMTRSLKFASNHTSAFPATKNTGTHDRSAQKRSRLSVHQRIPPVQIL